MYKILVTGGAGFIGSNLVRFLLKEKGCSIVNLDKLTYAGNAESLSDLADDLNYTLVQIDLCEAAAVKAAFDHYQPDAVMHLAAESHVDRSIDGPGQFIQTNIVGTYNLLQASLAYWRILPDMEDGRLEIVDREESTQNPMSHIPSTKKNRFRFLHVSTDEVYGSLGSEDAGFSETTRYDPHSPYSASKAASDHLVRAWGDTYGLPVLVTNCSNNYGPYQFPEKLIPVVILKCLRGEPIPVYGKGENIRDWLYVEDHADALYTVLTKGRVGETYNIGGNNEKRNIDLVRMLCRILDAECPMLDTRSDQSSNIGHRAFKSFQELITFVTDRPGHDMRYAIDATKIREELGWEPKEDFESGFRKTVRWYLENREWWEAILAGTYRLERLGENR